VLGALETVLTGSTLGEPFGRWRMQWSKSLTPPPRMFDELSGRVSQVAPAAINEHVRIWEKSVPPTAFSEYVRDFWQRSVLFLDILRERGNQHQEMFSLLRIIPPEGAEIDDRKRPVFVIDPRAGQGPGIGGFKQLSEIGEAFSLGSRWRAAHRLRPRFLS
jgi:hypothetical protein